MPAAATHEASRSYRDVLRKRHVTGPPSSYPDGKNQFSP